MTAAHIAAQGSQVCHCEAPTGPWQSRRTRPNREKAIGENATASPRLHPKGTSSRSGRHVREARVASALSSYNILSKKSKIAINPDFSGPISPFRLLSQKKSVMMEGRICNCIFHGRFCRCPAFFRCITQPRPVKTNEGHGLSPGRLSKKLPSQKLRREEKRERKPSGCPFASNHPPQRQNCKIRYNKNLFCNSESSLAKSPKGLFDKLTGFRPAPTGLCLHAGEEGFSWKKMICYGSWGPSPNPFF